MEALAKPKIPSVGRRSRGATTCINTAGNYIEVCYVRKCTENQVKKISRQKWNVQKKVISLWFLILQSPWQPFIIIIAPKWVGRL